jgi:hypothetical protein
MKPWPRCVAALALVGPKRPTGRQTTDGVWRIEAM